jgi:hypothetical protein
MSWDVSVVASKSPPPPVGQMADDWKGELLGSADEVRAKISTCLPAVDWSDVMWGILDGDGFTFEFNVGNEDPSDGFMIHVHGGGDAITPLLKLAKHWGWYLLDCTQGEWLHHCDIADAGWQGFQAYRDRVIMQLETKE